MGQRLRDQAERDIQTAGRLLYPGTYYAAANYAHQAAEKALKAAFWHLRGEEPPWNHDLVKCASQVAQRTGGLPPTVEAAVEQLQPVFDESRYPSGNLSDPIPADLIGEEDAWVAVRMAEEVLDWVQGLLQQPPGKTRRKTSY